MTQVDINPDRLADRLERLGRIGETPTGMRRMAFTPADVEGRAYVAGLMREAGLTVRTDTAGNVIGRVEGSVPGLPAIGIGSHADTVPNGGKYDGALGVMAAIECLQNLKDRSVATRHPIEVLNFTNEEGTSFHTWLFGSSAMAGALRSGDLTAVDVEGVSLGQRLRDVGGDAGRIHEARRERGEFSAYLELHIEQGPVLHGGGVAIGEVTAITGRAALSVCVKGSANHAGTTPMPNRRDALLAASHVVQAVNAIASQEEICRVGTVGIARVSPNAENVIPGVVDLTVDFRDVELDRIAEAQRRLREVCRGLASDRGVEVEVLEHGVTRPTPMNPGLRRVIRAAAEGLGLEVAAVPSGAGHDAQSMAEITDAGMIFVPSVGGVSHSPDEYTRPEDCANGARVLLRSLLAVDAERD